MEKKRIVVIPEYLNRSASRDEQHLKPLPAAKMFDNLRQAFEWSFQSELLGDYFGWHAPVYLVSGCKLILITKTTEKLIREEELFEALEGLKAVYYKPAQNYTDTDSVNLCDRLKQKLNSIYGYVATAEKNRAIEWRIMMSSGGGTVRVFSSGFKNQHEATQYASSYDWQWKDENDFVWDLYVEEDDE